MKYIFFVSLVLIAVNASCATIISGQVKGIHMPQTIFVNVPFDCWYYKQLSKDIITNGNGFFSTAITVERPQSIFILFNEKRILVYVEPGKNLSVIFDSTNLQQTLRFSGDLKLENEFRKSSGLTFFSLYPQSWNDSMASSKEIITAIKNNQLSALKKLAALKASRNFKMMTKADIQYFLPVKLWEIIYSARDPLTKTKQEWQEALKLAYQQYPLSNNAAVNSYYYQNTITYYARYLNSTASDKQDFERTAEKIFKKRFAEINLELKSRGKRYWEYKAFNDVLKGLALEQATASFIDEGINQGNLNYLQEAYSDFLFRFSKSRYHDHVDKIMQSYFSSQSLKGEDLVFENPDSSYKSVEDILKKHTGRVVLVDLWGSWCGPCRQEFSYNKPLKVYFSGKPVDFVYIDFEHDIVNPELIWKRTVKYYNLTGTHILADSVLKNNINKMYGPKGIRGYPSYILVDKEGTVKDLYAGAPSSKDILYQQIEKLLK